MADCDLPIRQTVLDRLAQKLRNLCDKLRTERFPDRIAAERERQVTVLNPLEEPVTVRFGALEVEVGAGGGQVPAGEEADDPAGTSRL